MKCLLALASAILIASGRAAVVGHVAIWCSRDSRH